MLTAAVRDLHRCYPKRFVTDVRTGCPEFWEHNPHLTALSDEESQVQLIDCSYPLINKANVAPYHCLHGFIDFLNKKLGLSIYPTEFKGDIHFSPQEKAWYSQVHEWTGRPIPFWLIAAGGKYDITLKWWATERYQQVVDHFRDRIQFVQVGTWGHHHPRLDGVIDLRGRTDLRELIRLVYHCDGILCPTTSLMHLAAAVETRRGQPLIRPCVVIAGGREPAHWEAYPGHQFIHANGALSCCSTGGCWKDRLHPLRDGDHRDHPESMCIAPSNNLPRCLDLITSAEVIRRIELYYQGGRLRYLSAGHRLAAWRAVKASSKNSYNQQPLNLHSAGRACDAFVASLREPPADFKGRGIIICGGGLRYFPSAWVCIRILRRLGCTLPIELWHLGHRELPMDLADLLSPLNVRCVDAFALRRRHPARRLKGWELKCYAILHSRFKEVLFLDADNVPVVNPKFLFDSEEFQRTGAVFWPDYNCVGGKKALQIWRSCGLRRPNEHEFETGQILVDKQRCWTALRLAMWFNENSDFYYQYVHGDKETFHLAFRKVKQPYTLVRTPIHSLTATMCQHDFQGQRIFQHRNGDKWDVFLKNRRIQDFWLEEECREELKHLQQVWKGSLPEIGKSLPKPLSSAGRRNPRIELVMISCRARDEIRQRTLNNLADTDWNGPTPHLQLDEGFNADPRHSQTQCAFMALQAAKRLTSDYYVFLEDDLEFNRHFGHNLHSWEPLRSRRLNLGSLYNPGVQAYGCDMSARARLVEHTTVFGSQALVLSAAAVKRALARWHTMKGMQDLRIARLSGAGAEPAFYHSPSLVQHVGKTSTWGGRFHQAVDFDPNWRR